ncbi:MULTISPECIES: DNA topoisomerase IV subunit A [unclassified Hwanghaeella]|jgi:topoisomerase-4 subunit A|uniref:DNA topoisomerase IV subunit A n=1 Tax=unclassified Hwanghaeella TaxID=2605944 RepID=UPI000C992831|nr:DNA topoisomerase IV subunit A [Rhodospirillales bacterium]|tara:strand:+ start:128711 stop:130942 length:2232 start_codon:yes stop_codon:yes gene_type:complete
MTDDAPAVALRQIPLADALSERYLAYAMSTITSRSLPDARDGLKPVHRRLLFAMRELKLNPESGFKKCARIVGDVMGKYHPHGDSSIYEAMVRLAQEFAVRYPLVDGQGNFGNVDGDNPAAMRYTEARLTETANRLLQGIDDDAVDFRGTYDGEGREPVVLPSAFPNLLANGAAGIAVGMATSIPPHNVAELCEALIYLIKTPNASVAKLMDFIPGPDFPTGGTLVESREAIAEAYGTGRGSFRIRARWEVEQLKGGTWQIVVTEIPYQVQKSRLIERIAELIQERKIAILGDIMDESAEDVRIVIEPKSRNVDPEMLMESLFRYTDLETRFSLNMNVLTEGGRVPKVVNLREALQAFLDHRHDVLIRRSEHRKAQIERRLEILKGYLICYLNLDEVIRIIREEDHPKQVMMDTFALSDLQAESILNMRLRSLRRLEEFEIKKEYDGLETELSEIVTLLADGEMRWKHIADEMRDLKKAYGPTTPLGRRRTEMGSVPTAVIVPLEAMIEKEPVTIVCSAKGWIRALKGHLASDAEIKYKEDDGPRFVIPAQTTDKVLIFGTNGRFYTIGADKLPGGRGNGEPLRLMIDLPNDHEIVSLMVHQADRKLLVASTDGRGFMIPENDVLAQTRNGKQILNVSGKVEAMGCRIIDADHDSVAVIGKNRKLLVFDMEELPEMARGRGVILQKYRDGGLSDIKTFAKAEGLTWQIGDRTRTEHDLSGWIGKRAQAGRMPPAGFPRSNKFS